MMTELQTKIWDALCELSGEEVARLFTNYYGNQLLSEDFKEFLQDEGYMESDEDEEPYLPTQMIVRAFDIDDDWYELSEDEQVEAINDYLSDEWGYCHHYYDYEVSGPNVYISNIEWDMEE